MLSGIPESVEYVQKSDDSRNSAIRIAYRNSLRPSSLPEPRHSSLKFSILVHFSVYFAEVSCNNPLPPPLVERRGKEKVVGWTPPLERIGWIYERKIKESDSGPGVP